MVLKRADIMQTPFVKRIAGVISGLNNSNAIGEKMQAAPAEGGGLL
jgi:hypothetical protein